MARGYFITFEGGEGTGKSTQIVRLAEQLRGRGHEVVLTREPGGTTLAEAVRAVLLDPDQRPDGLAEIFLLEAARSDHVARVIRPAVERGAVVLCDRFADSSWVYQGVVRGVGESVVDELNELATGGLEPDLTVIFDLEPGIGLDRARDRNSTAGRHESRLDDEPLDFHQEVRAAYRRLADLHPARVRLIDASGDPDEVFHRLLDVLPEELS